MTGPAGYSPVAHSEEREEQPSRMAGEYPWTTDRLPAYFGATEERRKARSRDLLRLLCRAATTSYYRGLWGISGESDEFRDAGILVDLPTTDIRSLRQSCAENRPFGTHVTDIPSDPILGLHMIVPDDANRIAVPVTAEMRSTTALLAARAWTLAGVGHGDVVQISQTFSALDDAWHARWGADVVKAIVVASGGLDATPSQRQFDFARRFRATAMYAPLAAVSAIAEVARSENCDPAQLGVRRILTRDRPRRSADRTVIEHDWEAQLQVVFGVFSWAATECAASRHQAGQLGMHAWSDLTLLEVLDADGRRARPGEVGEITETSWSNPAMPVVRVRTGYEGRLVAEACPCGLDTPRVVLV